MGDAEIATTVVAFLKGTGWFGLFVLIGWASYKRKWYWYHQYDEIRQDRDEWKALALRGTGINERALAAAAALATVPRQDAP